MNNMFGFLKTKKKHAGKNVIRKKLLLYFLISAVLVNSISFFTYNNTQILIKKLNSIFINDITLTNLSKNVDSVEISMKGYLLNSHSKDLQNYLDSSDRLRNMAADLTTTLSNNVSDLLLVDIKNMISTYLDDTDKAVTEKRGTDINGYSDKFNESNRIYDYINAYINKLKIYQFQENNKNYLELDSRLGMLQVFNIIVILVGMIVNIILIIWFAFSITEPIIKLSKSANAIAEGNYNMPDVKVDSNDEVKTLATAFNRMAESIRKQLVEIRQKAQIENQLKETEMQNLKIKSTLDEAQLRSLQSQIDPHYIFNTLNAGMQIAMFEGAERTQSFLENFSQTLRYNLGNIRKPATLNEEIENIDNYIYLLKERFGDKIAYVKHVDKDLPEVFMPRMILQPIVENSFIHGIGEKERGGLISLSAACIDGKVCVEISDNGSGMSKKTIAKIMSEDYLNFPIDLQERPKNNYSIGMRNVIGRLMLYYHAAETNQVIEIKSELGLGTKVIIKLRFQDLK
jgi:sensor histidine kinase YesM